MPWRWSNILIANHPMLRVVMAAIQEKGTKGEKRGRRFLGGRVKKMERETRFELATSTLARLHSTTELFPLI